jgi:O-antigen/teichoic acid export membrane protein
MRKNKLKIPTFSSNSKNENSLSYGKNTIFFSTGTRILSGLFTTCFFILAAKATNSLLMSELFLYYGVGTVLIWLADFGLINSMIIYKANNSTSKVRQSWIIKILLFFITLLVTVLVQKFMFHKSLFFVFLYVSVLFDIFTDGLVSYHQTANDKRALIYSQIIKKFSFVFLLQILQYFNLSAIHSVLLSIFVPSITVFLAISVWIGLERSGLQYEVLAVSSKVWLVSGGSVLANLEPLILSLGGLGYLNAYTGIVRRLTNFVGLLGNSLSFQNLFDASKPAFNIENAFNKLIKVVLLSSFLSVFIAIFVDYFLTKVYAIDLGGLDLIALQTLCLIVPFSIFNSNVAAILTGLKDFKFLTALNYILSTSYLLILTFTTYIFRNPFGLVFAVSSYVLFTTFISFYRVKKHFK